MAIEIALTAQLSDSEAIPPGLDGIMLRCMKSSSVVAEEGTDVANCIAIGKARFETLWAEVRDDMLEQFDIMIQSFEKQT